MEKNDSMALARDSEQTVFARAARDPESGKALLDEAATLLLNGEPEPARLVLRDLVNATVGFEQLALDTAKHSKSLHQRLFSRGNPSMDNLAAILGAVQRKLAVEIEAHTTTAA